MSKNRIMLILLVGAWAIAIITLKGELRILANLILIGSLYANQQD